jgi:F-type H+-transporting ATPase subunit delta
MAALLDKAGAGDLVQKFIGLVARNRRLFALKGMIRAFEAELARRRGEVLAEVAAAQALTPAESSALNEALARTLGGGVKVDFKIDRGLIGGMTVKIGSRLFDGSLKSKLERLQLAMKGTG